MIQRCNHQHSKMFILRLCFMYKIICLVLLLSLSKAAYSNPDPMLQDNLLSETTTTAASEATATKTSSSIFITEVRSSSSRKINNENNKTIDSNNKSYNLIYLRGGKVQKQQKQRIARKLPGNEMYDNIDLNSAEAGFIIGMIVMVVVVLCLLSCLCNCLCGGYRRNGYNNGGGGSNCLWDLVAIVCLWELCCDNDGIMSDGFMRF